jgi:hypothetical protein
LDAEHAGERLHARGIGNLDEDSTERVAYTPLDTVGGEGILKVGSESADKLAAGSTCFGADVTRKSHQNELMIRVAAHKRSLAQSHERTADQKQDPDSGHGPTASLLLWKIRQLFFFVVVFFEYWLKGQRRLGGLPKHPLVGKSPAAVHANS